MNARQRHPVSRALAALFVAALAAVTIVPAGTAAAKPGHDDVSHDGVKYMTFTLERVVIDGAGTYPHYR
jgi:hypothetical protein